MCSLCGAVAETIVHLFLTCIFTTRILNKCVAFLGLTLTVSEASDIENKVDASRNMQHDAHICHIETVAICWNV